MRSYADPVRLTPLASALTAATIALTACGGETDQESDEESDEEQVENAVVSFFDASKEEDAAKFCDVVIVEPIPEGEQCEDQISADDFEGSGDVENLEVTDIEVDGESATAQVAATVDGEEETQDLSFRKADGDWKIDFGL